MKVTQRQFKTHFQGDKVSIYDTFSKSIRAFFLSGRNLQLLCLLSALSKCCWQEKMIIHKRKTQKYCVVQRLLYFGWFDIKITLNTPKINMDHINFQVKVELKAELT